MDERGWRHARGVLSLDPPAVMGILNVTPDSFFDGGRWTRADHSVDVAAAVAHARRLVDEGAALVDVGGESTRPGSAPVPVAEELRRVVPIVEALADTGILVSIDTRHAEVARAALGAGAAIVNDVSGLADPEMVGVVAGGGAGLVLGHLRGTPADMQERIAFARLLPEVAEELGAAAARAVAGGVDPGAVLIDPGIGFGKTPRQSAALVAASSWLRAKTGHRVLVGASRKSFLGRLARRSAQDEGPEDRLVPSVVAAVLATQQGASVVRVHDVRATVEALALARTIAECYAAEDEVP